MSLFSTIILSIVEGLTEFLPVSSTGHLILTSHLLSLPQTDFLKTFEIFIQLGAIFAVIGFYIPHLAKYIRLWDKLLVAFLPSAVVGFFLYPFIKGYLLGSTNITLLALFFGGVAIIILEIFHHEQDHHLVDLKHLNFKQAFIVGVTQTLSVIPGVSRAAASIAGGLIAGLKHQTAVEFSFFLAVPTILAATTLDLYQSNFSFTSTEMLTLALGFVFSFFTALISIKFLLNFVKNHTFVPFGIYRICLSLLYWLILK